MWMTQAGLEPGFSFKAFEESWVFGDLLAFDLFDRREQAWLTLDKVCIGKPARAESAYGAIIPKRWKQWL